MALPPDSRHVTLCVESKVAAIPRSREATARGRPELVAVLRLVVGCGDLARDAHLLDDHVLVPLLPHEGGTRVDRECIVARRAQEEARVVPELLVLLEPQPNDLDAGRLGAFADERDWPHQP